MSSFSHPRSLTLVVAALLTALAGCGTSLTGVQTTPLTADQQRLVDALQDVSTTGQAAFNLNVSELPDVANAASVYSTLAVDTAPPVAQAAAGLYAGPFPAAGSLPGGYQVRPAGGWLQMNPTYRNSGEGLSVTSTYWTPAGTQAASAAQTLQARLGSMTLQDLYVSPNTVVSDVPAFFKGQLNGLVADQVLQACETYKVYNNSSLSGPAVGYRWLVLKDGNQSWIRALQVTQADGTKVDHTDVSANYAMLNGSLTPMHTGYSNYMETGGIGYSFTRDTDLSTGQTTGQGQWHDATQQNTLAIQETSAGNGTCQRVLTRTLAYGETLALTENYQAGSPAGSGTVTVNGIAAGTLAWDSRYTGTVTIGSASAPYVASKKSASGRPAALNISLQLGFADIPTAPPVAGSSDPLPVGTPTPTSAPSCSPSPFVPAFMQHPFKPVTMTTNTHKL